MSTKSTELLSPRRFGIGPIVKLPHATTTLEQSQDEQHSSKLWNIGNPPACDMQGFMMMFGGTMCAFYTLSLCTYYLSAVKYNKGNKEFAEITERKLHGISIVYSFGTCTFYLAAGFYNNFPDGNMCFVIEKPPGCHKNHDVECERGEQAANVLLFWTLIPLMLICVGIQYSLGSFIFSSKKTGTDSKDGLH